MPSISYTTFSESGKTKKRNVLTSPFGKHQDQRRFLGQKNASEKKIYVSKFKKHSLNDLQKGISFVASASD